MINLLPPDAKKQLAAGRANRLLSRYLLLFLAFAAALLAVFALTYLFLDNMERSYQATIDQNNQESLVLAESQREVAEFRANLATAKQILDKQINYSSITLRVANTIPRGVVIEQLTLDPATIGTPAKLNARVTSEAAAQRLKDALNASDYFTDAYYDTVTRTDDRRYPMNVILTVTFTEELLND